METFRKDKFVDTFKDIKNFNVHTTLNRSSKYVKEKRTELKIEIDYLIIIVRNFNIPLTIPDRTT